MNNVFMYSIDGKTFKKLGEITEAPTLVKEHYDDDELAYKDLYKPVTITYTFRFSKEVSKHLHYARHSKKFRQRKKHCQKLIKIRGALL